MITGTVTPNLEPTVALVVFGPGGQQQRLDAVVDTGFNGFLTLPPTVVTALGLAYHGRSQAVLGDGTVVMWDVYHASVLWDGVPRSIHVNAAGSSPLVGLKLLAGYELRIEVRPGGAVAVTTIP